MRVDYALTPLGESLMPVVNVIKARAERHIGEIEASRAAYDSRLSSPLADVVPPVVGESLRCG